MKRWVSAVGLAVATLFLAGCNRTGGATSRPADEAAAAAPYLNHAQPRLPTLKLWLGSAELEAEVARRNVEIYTGMMFRTNLADTAAMLFVFPTPDRRSFYMRNTQVPLTAAYLAPDGTVLELHDLKPFDETPAASQSDNIQFVLEVPKGWFQRHNVTTGAVIRTPYGGLAELDWRTLRARGRP